ncbi:MAG: FkbM family methyltransferase [Candidatus Latescibacteria bacterium]|nr:FkbM family methyltransferase [Candidatus Latescibacterota bacterium]
MKEFYSRFISKGDLCFDIGANLGNRVEVFLKLGAYVIAVEPQRSCVLKLHKKFGANPDVIIIPKALGESEGSAELLVSDASTISSLSKEWIEQVKASGRFSTYQWNKSENVTITTFDKLIENYGVPVFAKIDVEGFESKVISGLSQPAKVISFEFTPEFIKSAVDSIKHLTTLGKVSFNYSLGETMTLVLSEWTSGEEMITILISLREKMVFGDVYAWFKT